MMSFAISVTAIEMTLRWNGARGTNDIESTGQYMALFTGLGSIVSVLWQIQAKRQEEDQAQEASDGVRF